jgi:putative transposase
MDKYLNKYRTPTARATWWNYANTGLYFITICTDNREQYFGKIENGKMILSEIGLIVQQEWDKSFEIRAELFCDVFVIMPDHIHAILRIVVRTHGRAYIPQSHGVAYRPPKSISSFVAGFKSAATKRINEFRNMPKSPVWQHRFHDHIIRNESEYFRIKEYILENPKNWNADKLNNKI